MTRCGLHLLGSLGLLAVLVGALVACDDHPARRLGHADGPRIVTLAPALTQMLVDLGLEDRIVGVAEHDAAAPEGTPVAGTFIRPDTERLAALAPTHVLTQAGKEGVPAHLRTLRDRLGFRLVSYPHVTRLDQITEILVDKPGETAADAPPPLGVLFDRRAEARRVEQRLRRTLEAIRRATESADRPRVLMLLATEPVMASGRGVVHDELLDYAGGVNAIEQTAVTAPTFDREGLIALRPDVILLLLPGAPPLREGDARLDVFADLPIPAVEHDRVALINDPKVLLPSTSLDRIAVRMARAIHPELAPRIDRAVAAVGVPTDAMTSNTPETSNTTPR